MSLCIENLPHSCGSSDGLQVFLDEDSGDYTGYCFVCDTYVATPYAPGSVLPSVHVEREGDIEAELEEIDGLIAVDLPDRKLKKEALDYFDVKVGLSEVDGETPVFHYYPYLKDGKRVGYKTRLIAGKKMWSVGEMRDIDLFGWQQAVSTGAKRLYITEGELDAVALYQALKDKSKGGPWAKYDPAVVSLAKGSSSARKALSENASKLRQFKEIVLVFDQDEAGRKAVAEAMLACPSARTVSLPSVDPNACLMEGREKALTNACLFQDSAPKNTRIVNGSSFYEAGREQPEWGLSWPWPQLTDMTRGIRFGETYYLGAGVKMGKSEIVNALAKHFIIDHQLPVFLAKPEEANKQTWKKLLGKVNGKIFHDPKVEFNFEAYDEASTLVGDRLHMLDLYQHVGWDSLRADIVSSAVEYGCKAVFIDPITNLVNGISAAETDTILKDIAQELAAMAKDLDIVIFIFCHLKAPGAGDAHERGGKVYSYQFAGSRAMMRSCNYMLGLEGNKDPDLPEESRNVRRLVLLEDREFGEVGVVRLYWDHNTQLFNELREE